MEWIVSIAICYGTCVVLELIFLGIAARRESGKPLWLLVVLCIASILWLAADAWLQWEFMEQAGRNALSPGGLALRQLAVLPFVGVSLVWGGMTRMLC